MSTNTVNTNTTNTNTTNTNTTNTNTANTANTANGPNTANAPSTANTNTAATHVGGAGTFVALEISYALIAALREIMPAIRKSDRDLADQIQRAASSVALNVAEGQRSMKGNRLKHYSIANGSANEVKAGLFVAKAWGWIDEDQHTREALAVLDRLLGLLWGLTRR